MSLLIIENMTYPIFLVNMKGKSFHVSLFFMKGINIRICSFKGRKLCNNYIVLAMIRLLSCDSGSKEMYSSF